MTDSPKDAPDVVLVGAGIMSATLGTFLKELEPSLTISMFETLHDCAQESSQSWNNAGTGHAANCELNYTPRRPDGSVDIARALTVNTEFDVSRQFWAYLVRKGVIGDPSNFIRPCQHMSFVSGPEDIAFLRARYETMAAHHCYSGMEYSEDPATIAEWAPLIIEGRDSEDQVAATRMVTGTDVDFGALTHLLIAALSKQDGFTLHCDRKVTDLRREDGGRWRVSIQDTRDGRLDTVSAKFVFVGAGGASVELLQKSRIPEGLGYGGFPVSGIWLRCDRAEVVQRHHAKVYGKAPSGSPPMSVPHLDTRVVDGTASLLFGPYAGFSTKFLKHGALTDFFESITSSNVLSLLEVGKDNLPLVEYLVGQALQTQHHQFRALKEFCPTAREKDWNVAVAGQRVQIIKRDDHRHGTLEFGTELVSAEDKSLAVLLGASPGASTAAFIATQVLERHFDSELTEDAWLPALRRILPTYGIDLARDADACRATRADTASVLKLRDI